MKLKKYISISLLSVLILSNSSFAFANTNNIKQERLIGNQRYQTAIEVSKSGWYKADNAIITSGFDLVSALCSTPLAKLKNAPILLTDENKLHNDTKAELIRLGVKNVYLVEAGNRLSSKVQSDLKALGVNVHYIKGKDIYDMSLKVANEINKVTSVTKVAIVNGETGLADATSISGPAAQNNMPIILTSKSKGLNYAKGFINNSKIKEKYVIGGETAIPSSIISGINNVQRLTGLNRDETNMNVIKKFYPNKKLDKVFIVKNGIKNNSHLVDAIALGSLSAKKNSPILLTRENINQEQKSYLNSVDINELVQIGGGDNTKAFNQAVSIKGGYLNNLTKKISLIQAKQILLNRFSGGQILYITYDQDDNEYDAKIVHNNKVYEVEISAYNGAFIDIEIDGYYNGIVGSNNSALTNESKVRNIIAAKFPGSTILKLKYDRDDNEYEANIKYNNKYYEVTVSALNGAILEFEIDGAILEFEIDDDYNHQSNSNKPTNSNVISRDKARSVLLARFPGASIFKLEYDRDDREYEAELKYRNVYYEVTINAVTGKIIEIEEIDD